MPIRSVGPRVLALVAFAGLGSESEFAIAEPTEAASPYELAYEKYALPNGLEVILHQDQRLPTVAVNIWYHVGATHEPPGSSGFAHLFEHLMFEGSKHAGHEFDPLLESVGGTNMNATTSWDRTNYFETVPAEHLELALWLEADRMGFMIDTLTPERFDVQRDVVKNERRESYENAPYGKSWLRVYETLFPEGHPYRGAVIGTMEDLSAADLDDARAFFGRYYSPGNATLCLSGYFDQARARAMIEKYFGTLTARGGRVPAQKPSVTPSFAGVRVEVPEAIELEQVVWAWLAPPAYGPHQPALDIGMRVLGSGKASRLYQALVQTGVANWVSAQLDDNQLATMVTIDVGVATGHTTDEVEAVLTRELDSLAKGGPSADELARAKKGLELGLASELQLLNSSAGEGGRAGQLQRLNHYLGDPGGLPEWVAERRAVDGDAVAKTLSTLLAPAQRATVITRRAGGKDAAK
jgi:zinc protease